MPPAAPTIAVDTKPTAERSSYFDLGAQQKPLINLGVSHAFHFEDSKPLRVRVDVINVLDCYKDL